MSASGGEKRPAVVGPEEDRSRSQRRPRLEASASTDEVSDTPSDAAVGVDVDRICNIASCMKPGCDLMNLCISVGPVDAAKVRTGYLRDNEQYVTASLQKLRDIRHLSVRQRDVSRRILHLPLFDKCRDNIAAWMQVNSDWRDRCTDENMERYKGIPFRTEANLAFNSPAVAIEIGLLEVLRFHVEEKGVDVNRRFWNGFNSDNVHLSNDLLIKLALFRGDIDILDFLLSVDGFDFTLTEVENDAELEHDILLYCFDAYRLVNEQCFKSFIRHHHVNVDALDRRGRTPLCVVLDRLDRWTGRDDDLIASTSTTSSSLAARILVLLEAGADPHDLDNSGNITLIEYAKSALGRHTESRYWRSIVQKMEEMSISSAGE